MLAQRWTENGEMYKVVPNSKPNPADSWMGQCWYFAKARAIDNWPGMGWKFRLRNRWVCQVYLEWSLRMGC